MQRHLGKRKGSQSGSVFGVDLGFLSPAEYYIHNIQWCKNVNVLLKKVRKFFFRDFSTVILQRCAGFLISNL